MGTLEERLAVARELITNVVEVAGALRGASAVTVICPDHPHADTVGAAPAMGIVAGRLGATS